MSAHERDDFFNAPYVSRHTRLHRGRDAQRPVYAPDVVIHEVERDGRGVVLHLLAEGFGSRVKTDPLAQGGSP
jgi:hypothetical protein